MALLRWLLVAGACGCAVQVPPDDSAAAHGAWLFTSPTASPAASNVFACSDCHHQRAEPLARVVLPGAPMAGAVQRPHFWAGAERDLLAAINHCRYWFMDARTPWSATEPQALAMASWLATLPADLPAAQTLTFVYDLADVPPGNATAGAAVYNKACAGCHGVAFTGQARLSKQVPVLPGEFAQSHVAYTPGARRLTFLKKVRHGPFLGYGGKMPPFAREVLSDAALGDLVAYFGF